jgi:acyl carrier protein
VIWQDALGIEQVGLTDNFFELGGNSLLIIKIISQIKQFFEVELSLKDLFINSLTIKNIASLIEIKQENHDDGLDLIFEALDELAEIEED